MKKVWKNKSLMAVALALVFATASMPALANSGNRSIPVELKFVGETKNQYVFLLTFDGSADDNEFVVSISDESGIPVYKETVKAEKLSKRFFFNTEEFNSSKLKFQITSKKTNETVVYEVNQVVRTVQDVVVNKL